MNSSLSSFELIGLIVLAGMIIRLLARLFLKPTKAVDVPLVDELTGTTTFVFSRVNVLKELLIVIGMALLSFYVFFHLSKYFWSFFLVLLLLHPFMTIAELRFKDHELIIRNLYNICIQLTYKEIKVFSKGWGSSALTLIILKWHFVPLVFESRGELSEHMDAILSKLEDKLHKKRGVVI